MQYTIKTNLPSSFKWEDKIRLTQYHLNDAHECTCLSKRAILLSFASTVSLSCFDIIILDNLSKLRSLVYHHSNQELTLHLENSTELTLNIDWLTLSKLVKVSKIAEF